MKKYILSDSVEREALEIFGGKEQYQDARREWLEFVLPQKENTVKELETVFSTENCGSLTIVDPESGERFMYESYILRGPVKVYADEDNVWKIAIRRYQRTEMEQEVAALRETVAGLVSAQKTTA